MRLAGACKPKRRLTPFGQFIRFSGCPSKGKFMPEKTKRKLRHSLKFKLELLITSLVVSTVVLVSFFLLRQQQRSLTLEMTKRGLTIARDIAASAKNPLVTNDDV